MLLCRTCRQPLVQIHGCAWVCTNCPQDPPGYILKAGERIVPRKG
jgi:hypothetical protein